MGRSERTEAKKAKKEARAERKASRKGRKEERKVERKAEIPLGKLCAVAPDELDKAQKLARADVDADALRKLRDVAVALNDMLLAENASAWAKLDDVHAALFSWGSGADEGAPPEDSASSLEGPSLGAPAPKGVAVAGVSSAPSFTTAAAAVPAPPPAQSFGPPPPVTAPPPHAPPVASAPSPAPPPVIAAPAPVIPPLEGSSSQTAPPQPVAVNQIDDESTMAKSLDEIMGRAGSASALPFAGTNPAPPPAAASQDPGETGDGDVDSTGLGVSPMTDDQVLPFRTGAGSDPVPPLPEHLASLGVEHYAALCAESEVYPGWEGQVESRYGLQPGDRAAVDDHFLARLERDPGLRSEFETRRGQTKEWALKQRAEGASQ